MIRAIKLQTTGSGSFLNPSQGIFVRNDFVVVPVKLLSFTTEAAGQISLLKWTTATELNKNGFDIQRSNNALDWQWIGNEKSKAIDGHSNCLINYTFNDFQPLPGDNYYRLVAKSVTGAPMISEKKNIAASVQQNISASILHRLKTSCTLLPTSMPVRLS